MKNMQIGRKKLLFALGLSVAAVGLPTGSLLAGDGAAETWRACELAFESAGGADGGDEVDVDFTCGEATLRRPAFWDGGTTYRVRFAAPSAGRWTWRTSCASEKSLDGCTGALEVKPYAGDVEIYRRGFVRTQKGLKHFVYADGTPFLYLGDTHWGFGREAEDDATNAAVRHVETIAKRRVEQGFTVWQSEPIGCTFDLADGRVDAKDIAGFRTFDRAWRTVADQGLVHANAQFFYPSAMKFPLAADTNALRRLARYWVARYGAYPAMWTLGQEVDNNFYFGSATARCEWSTENNPYAIVARFVREFDCYRNPLTAHQENTWCTTVTGAGAWSAICNKHADGGRSLFADLGFAERCGHDWWGAQWSPKLNGAQNVLALRDYWRDPRVAVNYEGRYCGLWTLDFGARAQAWISFLSGFRGYGYGAADIWLFRSTYDMEKPSGDEVEEVTVAEKHTPWRKALEYPSANQMRHFRDFMAKLPWWRLEPDFGESRCFVGNDPLKGAFVAASDGQSFAVAYVFDRTSKEVGAFVGLKVGADYRLERFNPRTGEREDLGVYTVAVHGVLPIPDRPDCEDWVYSVVSERGAGVTPR